MASSSSSRLGVSSSSSIKEGKEERSTLNSDLEGILTGATKSFLSSNVGDQLLLHSLVSSIITIVSGPWLHGFNFVGIIIGPDTCAVSGRDGGGDW